MHGAWNPPRLKLGAVSPVKGSIGFVRQIADLVTFSSNGERWTDGERGRPTDHGERLQCAARRLPWSVLRPRLPFAVIRSRHPFAVSRPRTVNGERER